MIGVRQLYKNISILYANRYSFREIIKIILNDKLNPTSLRLCRRLVARGHSSSVEVHKPVDWKNDPTPWYTYPMLDFISDWSTKNWNIIEFGSGQSTLFWASRANKVIAYENNKCWIEELEKRIPRNVELRFFKNLQTLNTLQDINFHPDLVIVDGWKRLACAEASLNAFGDSPIYLLDNSDWFLQTAKILRAAGLTEIRFKGFGPINGYAWASSLFVNSKNLEKLNSISFDSEVPGGLHPGDTEECDLKA